MLRDTDDFLILRAAIRKGDVGQLERLIDQMLLLFLGTRQSNYAAEIIHLKQSLKAATPELRYAILSTFVINASGKDDKFVASDELLEFYNRQYGTAFARLMNSTHDIEKTIERMSLNREHGEAVKKTFMRNSARGTNYYTAKKVIVDVVSYAHKLILDGLAEKHPLDYTDVDDEGNQVQRSHIGVSDNIHQIGIDRLEDKLNTINTGYTARAARITNSSDNAMIAGNDSIDRADLVNRTEGGDYSLLGASVANDPNRDIVFGNLELGYDSEA